MPMKLHVHTPKRNMSRNFEGAIFFLQVDMYMKFEF